MRTLLIKEKRYPSFCRNRPDPMPQYSIEDILGVGVHKSKRITKDYYDELLESGEWTIIRDDDTIIIHEKI